MTTPKRLPSKLAFWSKHVEKWRSSGLKQQDYCSRQGISIKSFWRWKRIFSESTTSSQASKIATKAGVSKPLIPLSIVDEANAPGPLGQGSKFKAGIRLHAAGSRT
jgi:hypothetical protein